MVRVSAGNCKKPVLGFGLMLKTGTVCGIAARLGDGLRVDMRRKFLYEVNRNWWMYGC